MRNINPELDLQHQVGETGQGLEDTDRDLAGGCALSPARTEGA